MILILDRIKTVKYLKETSADYEIEVDIQSFVRTEVKYYV